MKTNVRSNTHRNTLRTFLWAGILTMLLPGLPGLSEERIWVGPSGGNWQTASNWSPAGVPKPEDVIVISNSSVALTAPVTISNQMHWGGGTLSGQSLNIAPGATLTMSGDAEKQLAGVVLENYGRVVWGGSGRIMCNVAGGGWATISNQAGGVFEVATDAALQAVSGSYAGTFTLENLGTMVKTGGAGTNVISGVVFNQRGLVDLQSGNWELACQSVQAGEVRVTAGSRLVFNGGGHTWGAGGYLNGVGGGLAEYRAGSVNFGTGLAVSGTTSNWVTGAVLFGGLVALPNFELLGGSLGGTFTNAGTLRWTGGYLGGSGTISIATNGLLRLEGAAEKQLAGVVLENYGRVVWGGSGRIMCSVTWGGWATISNQAGGVFEVATDAALQAVSGSYAGTFTLENLGTMVKTGGAGTNVISGVVFNQRGLVDLQSGNWELACQSVQAGEVRVTAGSRLVFNGGGHTWGAGGYLNGVGGGLAEYRAGSVNFGTGLAVSGTTSNWVTGAVLFGGLVALPNFELLGGSLGGTFTNAGTLRWTGGYLGGSGTISIATNGLLRLEGAAEKQLAGVVLENYGRVVWGGSGRIMCSVTWGGWATISNQAGGVFEVATDAALQAVSGSYAGTFTLENLGTMVKTGGAGTNVISGVVFNQRGLVDLQSGNWELACQSVQAGEVRVTAGSRLVFNGGGHTWGAGGYLNGVGGGLAEYRAGSVNFGTGLAVSGTTSNWVTGAVLFGGLVALPNFELLGGSLGGTFTNAGTLRWTGGYLGGSGTISIATNGLLRLEGAAEKQLAGVVLENYGRVVWGGSGRIMCSVTWGGWATISNQAGGVFEVATDAALQAVSGSYAGTFTLENLGTMVKTGGAGTNVISGVVFNQRGLVDLQSGNWELACQSVQAGEVRVTAGSRLVFNGGGHTWGAGGYLNGVGGGLAEYRAGSVNFGTGLAVSGTTSNWVTGAVLFGGLVALPNFELLGGSLGGTFTNAGTLRWTGGYLGGSGTISIATNGLLRLEGAAEKQLAGVVLENYGRVVWGGSGRIMCSVTWGGWATISNQAGGVFEVATDAALQAVSGSYAGTFTLENLGTMVKTGGAGTNVISGVVFNQRGLVDLQSGNWELACQSVQAGEVRVTAGSRLVFNGGGHTWGAGGYLNGVGGGLAEYRAGSVNFGTGLAVSGTTSNWVTGAVLFGGLVALPNFELLGGSLGGTFTNAGTLRWTGGYLGGSGTISIATNGLLRLEGAAEKQLAGVVLENYGRVVWGGSGRIMCSVTWGGWATISNQAGGVFEVATDAALQAVSGSYAGTFTLENLGTMVKTGGAGTNVISGVVFNQRGLVDLQSGNWELACQSVQAGEVRVTAGSRLVFNGGGHTWGAGGYLNGVGGGLAEYRAGSVNFGTGLAVSGTTSNWVTGAVLFGGLVALPNFELLGGSLGGTFTNAGTLRWTGGYLGGSGTISIATNGLLRLEGAAEKQLAGVVLENYGRVVWGGSGRIMCSVTWGGWATISNQAGGVFEVATDAALQAVSGSYAGTFTLENLGTMVKTGGAGTNVISGVVFNNRSLLELQSGALRFGGDFAFLPGGACSVVLGGITPGTQFSHVLVDGTATLAGNLAVRLINGFVPEIGATFRVLQARTRNGTFDNPGLSYLSEGLGFLSLYDSSGLSIQVQRNVTAWPLGMQNGQFHLLISGNVNSTYAVQASGDMTSWTNLLITNLTVSSFEYVDPDTNAYPQRFYRVIPVN